MVTVSLQAICSTWLLPSASPDKENYVWLALCFPICQIVDLGSCSEVRTRTWEERVKSILLYCVLYPNGQASRRCYWWREKHAEAHLQIFQHLAWLCSWRLPYQSDIFPHLKNKLKTTPAPLWYSEFLKNKITLSDGLEAGEWCPSGICHPKLHDRTWFRVQLVKCDGFSALITLRWRKFHTNQVSVIKRDNPTCIVCNFSYTKVLPGQKICPLAFYLSNISSGSCLLYRICLWGLSPSLFQIYAMQFGT